MSSSGYILSTEDKLTFHAVHEKLLLKIENLILVENASCTMPLKVIMPEFSTTRHLRE